MTHDGTRWFVQAVLIGCLGGAGFILENGSFETAVSPRSRVRWRLVLSQMCDGVAQAWTSGLCVAGLLPPDGYRDPAVRVELREDRLRQPDVDLGSRLVSGWIVKSDVVAV